MIVSVAAQKGGVGKSSLCVHLGGCFAEAHGKVLLCDIDPQHSLSSTFVDDVYSRDKSMKDLLYDPDLSAKEVLEHTSFENIDIIACNLGLGSIERELIREMENPFLLFDKLDEISEEYDLILVDCPPSIGIFTQLALVASDYVLIPLECSSYAVKSTMYLLEFINEVKQKDNHHLEILGFVINRVDARRRLEQDYRDLIREQFSGMVFQAEIKNSVKYAEAVTLKIPINFYKPKSEQAEACRQLMREILDRQRHGQEKL